MSIGAPKAEAAAPVRSVASSDSLWTLCLASPNSEGNWTQQSLGQKVTLRARFSPEPILWVLFIRAAFSGNFKRPFPNTQRLQSWHPHYGVLLLKGQVPVVMFGSRWLTPQIPVPSRIHHDKVLNTLGPVTTLVAQHLTLRCHHLQAEPSEPLETLPLFPRQEQSLVFFGDSFFPPERLSRAPGRCANCVFGPVGCV